MGNVDQPGNGNPIFTERSSGNLQPKSESIYHPLGIKIFLIIVALMLSMLLVS
jgi:hypothetical protein